MVDGKLILLTILIGLIYLTHVKIFRLRFRLKAIALIRCMIMNAVTHNDKFVHFHKHLNARIFQHKNTLSTHPRWGLCL